MSLIITYLTNIFCQIRSLNSRWTAIYVVMYSSNIIYWKCVNYFVSFQVQKLSALGYMPILFISQRHKGTGKLMADVVTHLPPTQNNTRFLTSMKRAYDFIIKLDGKISFMYSSLVVVVDFFDNVY